MIPGIVASYISAAPPSTQSVFDPAAKSASVTLSNGNRSVAPGIDDDGFAVCADPKTSGKFYLEMVMDSIGSTNQAVGAGIIFGVISDFMNYIGGQASGYGSWVIGSGGSTRCTFNNGIQSNAMSSTPIASSDRVRIAIDIDAGNLWLSYWTGTTWIGGGDPASGTSPTYTFTPGLSARFAANPRGLGAVTTLVLPSNWASSAPAGYGIWTD